MANEFNVNVYLTVSNGSFADQFNPGVTQFDQAAIGYSGGVASVGTTEEAVDMGDLVTPGFAIFQNLDSTNFVTVGTYVAATYYPMVRLEPGEFCFLRLTQGVTFYWKADTAACQVLHRIYED